MKCKFCGSEVEKEGQLYCSPQCMHYENQLNWLNRKKDKVKKEEIVK